MIIINDELLQAVTSKAEVSPRKRMNHNFHPQLDDPLQRMLNCMEPETYVRPHKHENPDKCEAFIVLKGKIMVVEFDDAGHVVQHALLEAGTGVYGAEIAPRIFHTLVSLEKGSAVYEIKNGPYSPLNDKNFAAWAPAEGSPACREYLNSLLALRG